MAWNIFKLNEADQLVSQMFSYMESVFIVKEYNHHTSIHSKEKKLKEVLYWYIIQQHIRKGCNGNGLAVVLIFYTSLSWVQFQPLERFCLHSGSDYKMQTFERLQCQTSRMPVQTRQCTSHFHNFCFEPDHQKESQQSIIF